MLREENSKPLVSKTQRGKVQGHAAELAICDSSMTEPELPQPETQSAWDEAMEAMNDDDVILDTSHYCKITKKIKTKISIKTETREKRTKRNEDK